ncbi:MAG: proton-conducting transporter membrane subunit, partial [Chitinophagaceae bacterium]
MNAIILTAIWGVVMMFGGVYLKSKTSPKYLAIAGLLLTLAANIAEYFGYPIFSVNTRGMLRFDNFSLLFITVVLMCTLIYFLLSSRDIEKAGSSVSEYFALIFFVLCGVAIAASFKTLLMLFLGIEIMSIPLYVLTGSDKRNLKSNEAALKYFLMGAFSTGLMLMGIALM